MSEELDFLSEDEEESSFGFEVPSKSLFRLDIELKNIFSVQESVYFDSISGNHTSYIIESAQRTKL